MAMFLDGAPCFVFSSAATSDCVVIHPPLLCLSTVERGRLCWYKTHVHHHRSNTDQQYHRIAAFEIASQVSNLTFLPNHDEKRFDTAA
jgi:hypothetical protein